MALSLAQQCLQSLFCKLDISRLCVCVFVCVIVYSHVHIYKGCAPECLEATAVMDRENTFICVVFCPIFLYKYLNILKSENIYLT